LLFSAKNSNRYVTGFWLSEHRPLRRTLQLNDLLWTYWCN